MAVEGLQGSRSVAEQLRDIGRDRKSAGDYRKGLVGPPQINESRSEIVHRRNEVGSDLDRLAEVRKRLIEPSQAEQYRAKIIVVVMVSRRDLEGLPVAGRRLFPPVEAIQANTAIVMACSRSNLASASSYRPNSNRSCAALYVAWVTPGSSLAA